MDFLFFVPFVLCIIFTPQNVLAQSNVMNIIIKLEFRAYIIYILIGGTNRDGKKRRSLVRLDYIKRKPLPDSLFLNSSSALNFVVGEPTVRATGIKSSYSEFMPCRWMGKNKLLHFNFLISRLKFSYCSENRYSWFSVHLLR